MKRVKCITFLIFLFLQFTAVNICLQSQNDSNVMFKLPELKITNINSTGDTVYEFKREPNYIFLSEDSISLSSTSGRKSFNVNSLKTIYIRNGTKFWSGLWYTAAITFGAGLIIGNIIEYPTITGDGPSRRSPELAFMFATVLAIPIGLIGGVMGALTPDYDEYDFTKVWTPGKYQYLLEILRKNRIAKKNS